MSDQNNSGWVRTDGVMFVFEELKRRIGKMETCRRLGLSRSFWWRLEHEPQNYFTKATVAKAIILLQEVRATGEVRHRLSIRHGASERGRPEKVPRNPNDFYISHGDADNEKRREYRHRTGR